MSTTEKPRKVQLFAGDTGWNWHALSTNGRILTSTNQGYARRGTAIRYMEVVTNARRRGIPVYAVDAHGVETRLY